MQSVATALADVTHAPLAAGVHYGIPGERYHRDDITAAPALTAGTAINLMRWPECPAKAWVAKYYDGEEAKPACEFGIAAHIAYLEPHRQSTALVVMDDENYRKGRAKAKRDGARANGQTPLLPQQVAKLQEMGRAMRNELCMSDGRPLPFQTAAPFLRDIFSGGHAEVTAIAGGAPMWKIRPDYVRQGDGFAVLVDYKTTAYSAERVLWLARQGWWHMRAAIYTKVWEDATGERAEYLYVHQNVRWPYYVHHSIIHPADLGTAPALIEDASRLFRECMESGRWESDVADPRILEINKRGDGYE